MGKSRFREVDCRATRTVRLAAGIATALATSVAAGAPGATGEIPDFSEGFLLGAAEMKRALQAGGMSLPPGVHALEVVINGESLRSYDLMFLPGKDSLRPGRGELCLPRHLVALMNLRAAARERLLARDGECIDLADEVEGARVEVDIAELKLVITVPQAAQETSARGGVPRSELDEGITAAYLDYTISHARFNHSQGSYAGATMGLNMGPWRLRHRGALVTGMQGRQYNRLGTTLERTLREWNSRLLIGEATTGGELFQSVGFKGLRVASDERMLPDSLRGYAPRVQGVADSNAVVTVRQNGSVIHQVTVAPGPFLIEDLYPTNVGGDLEVTVTEADGRERRSRLSFSAVPQAPRAGTTRYSVTAGALQRIEDSQNAAGFIEATYARGLNDSITLLGGAQMAEGYRAGLTGAAINTSLGAFGADVTHARARLNSGRLASGNSLRLNYQRYLAASGTNVGLAAYRYSSRNFLTLADAEHPAGDGWTGIASARQRYEVNLSQRINARSSLSLTAGHVVYWNAQRRRNDLQLGFQSSLGRGAYTVSATRFRQEDGTADMRLALSVNVPLGRSAAAPRGHGQLSQAAGKTRTQVGLNGSFGHDRAVNYSVSTSQGAGSDYSGYLSHQGTVFNGNAGFGRSNGITSTTASIAGSVIAHRDGVTFGQPLGESAVLLQARGARGAQVGGGRDIRIGRSGHAVLPHVSAYRWNRIELDPSNLPMDVELLQTSIRVAPTAGSIVRAVFPVRNERTLFIDATDNTGSPLPFAAPVFDEQGAVRGAVGQGGVIQLRGARGEGALEVRAGDHPACRIAYRMPTSPDSNGLFWVQATCVPLPPAGLRAGALPENALSSPRADAVGASP